MIALALGFSPAIANKIIGNGYLPDRRECVVGTSEDCQPKSDMTSITVVADGVMPGGGDCILGTAEGCSAKNATVRNDGSLQDSVGMAATVKIRP
jgi:hypothetical protein